MLPIEQVIDDIVQSAQHHLTTVIQAPPGAGKTTHIPLLLLQQPWLNGRILLIQPRRLAVMGAARRLAFNLQEAVGQRIGLTTRFDRTVGPECRVEVITDGVFLSRIQNDPELNGVGMVIFDEFHERSVNMDLGLAFALETQGILRDGIMGDKGNPLRLMVMSATLNGDQLSHWLDAPLLRSEGRSFPVETRYAPLPVNTRFEHHCVQIIVQSLSRNEGSVLVFLPGMKEIRRVQTLLEERLIDQPIDVFPLHASLTPEQQQQAIQPDREGRYKVVLSTNVAETSVTIDGIGVVVDSGLSRVSRYDERRGMSHLVTESNSRASAEQRKGRAGRTAPGIAYRLWAESQQASRKAYDDAEILSTDLSGVALQLAAWGAQNTRDLKLLNPPADDALQRARQFLQQLSLLGETGTLTPTGQQVTRLGLAPRIANLVWQYRNSPLRNDAITCAAILSEGDPLRQKGDQRQADIQLRLEACHASSVPDLHKPTLKRLQSLSKQLQRRLSPPDKDSGLGCNGDKGPDELSSALARSFPDRIAQQRQPGSGRYLLSNGKGVQLAPQDPLRQHRYLVVLDCQGTHHEPVISLACAIQADDLQNTLQHQIEQHDSISWEENRAALVVEQQLCLGVLVLQRKPLPRPWPPALTEKITSDFIHILCQRELDDLPWDASSEQWCARVQWLHQQQPDQWPDVSKQTLKQQAEHWLAPFLTNRHRLDDLKSLPVSDALNSLLTWDQQHTLQQQAPTHWTLPTGQQHPLDYSATPPVLRARLQEFYGLQQHPCLPDGEALSLELLSPARRPIQITRDLPGFWQGSYQQVAKEMRGRYPKHFWPDDPAHAQATTRTKNAMPGKKTD